MVTHNGLNQTHMEYDLSLDTDQPVSLGADLSK